MSESPKIRAELLALRSFSVAKSPQNVFPEISVSRAAAYPAKEIPSVEAVPWAYPKDSKIVLDVINRLALLPPEKQSLAYSYLMFLVPRSQEGGIWIGDIKVGKGLQSIIESRQSATEHEFADHPISHFPQEVQDYIYRNTTLLISATDKCTVGCSFCGVADHGRILNKQSFNAMNGITDQIAQHATGELLYGNDQVQAGMAITDVSQLKEKVTLRQDVYYWNTDPFDMRWGDKDYTDVAEYYWEKMKGRGYLYTSTAVPVGEELRVLHFIQQYFERREYVPKQGVKPIRISLTNRNFERVLAMRELLLAIYGPRIWHYLVITDNRNEHTYLAGDSWNNPEQITYGDIIGITCRDGVQITPRQVRSSVMAGSSKEVPEGQLYVDIAHTDGENTTYRVPRPNHMPLFNYYSNSEIAQPISYEEFTYHGTRVTQRRTVFDVNNPHRTLLRVAAIMHIITTINGPINESTMLSEKLTTKASRVLSERLDQADIFTLAKHLQDGNNNIPMQLILQRLQEAGVINKQNIIIRT